MTKTTRVYTEERRLNATHASGKAAALEAFAAKLRGCAGIAFGDGMDEKARWYRDVADDAANAAKLYRAEQRRHEEADNAV